MRPMTDIRLDPGSLLSLAADDSGAVTVDWVVLSAAIIGLGLVVLNPIAVGTSSLANVVSDKVTDAPVGYGN